MSKRDTAEMTSTQKALRAEAGEPIDPREEVIVKTETDEELFAAEDAKSTGVLLGEHTVRLVKPGKTWTPDIVHGVKVLKNGQLDPDKGETTSFLMLKMVDTETGKLIKLQQVEDQNGEPIHYTRRFYAVNTEGLRKNINKQYAGAAVAMRTTQMLDFCVDHPISVWLSWSVKYNQVQVDFFDREAWEREKKEKAKKGA